MLSYAALGAFLVSVWAGLLAMADARRFRSPTAWALAWLCLQSALWAGGWVFCYRVQDPDSWWLAFHLATTGYGFFGTPAFLTIALFAGFPPRKACLWAVPLFLYELTVVVHGWQAPLFATGFVPGPWGNTLVHNVGSPWYWADAGLYAPQVVGLVVLALLSWSSGGPPRRRTQARWLLAGFMAGNILTVLGSVVVPLAVPGFPSVGVLAGAVAPLFFVVVLRRYRLARPDDPRVLRHVLEGLDEPVALLGPDGSLRRVNQAWVQRGGPGIGEAIFEAFEPSATLRARWSQSLDQRKPCYELLCTRGGHRAFLSLTPVFDDFGDLVGAIAVLRRPGVFDNFVATHQLSIREAEVAALVLQGQSNRQIAEALGLSEATVKTYVRRVFVKTGTSHRLGLLRQIFRP